MKDKIVISGVLVLILLSGIIALFTFHLGLIISFFIFLGTTPDD